MSTPRIGCATASSLSLEIARAEAGELGERSIEVEQLQLGVDDNGGVDRRVGNPFDEWRKPRHTAMLPPRDVLTGRPINGTFYTDMQSQTAESPIS